MQCILINRSLSFSLPSLQFALLPPVSIYLTYYYYYLVH